MKATIALILSAVFSMKGWLNLLFSLCVILFLLILLIFALRLALPGFWITPDISTTEELNSFMMGFLQTVVAFFTLMVAAGTIFGFIFIKDASLQAATIKAEEVAAAKAEEVAAAKAEEVAIRIYGKNANDFKKSVGDEVYLKVLASIDDNSQPVKDSGMVITPTTSDDDNKGGV